MVMWLYYPRLNYTGKSNCSQQPQAEVKTLQITSNQKDSQTRRDVWSNSVLQVSHTIAGPTCNCDPALNVET